MPATPLELTARQRRLQLALRALTMQDVMRIWKLLDPNAIDDTWPGVEVALERLIEARRVQSATLAAQYVQSIRAAEAIPGELRAIFAEPVPPTVLRTSLRILGPETISRLADTAGVDGALRTALVRVAGAVTRHVLDGGRQTVMRTVDADEAAVGWARAAGGSCCAFCAMLAGRGPVYGRRSVQFRSHDHCACQAMPLYRHDAPWPENSRRYSDLWDSATEKKSGKNALNAFRQRLSGGGEEATDT